ncbi:MAG: sodium:solute symporter [Actinobacteria bacterium]|nr:sodium:solute symporter [Actinomycetota bacterium]
MNVALLIIFVFLALAIYLGIRARRGKDMDLEQWSVGGRGFGTIFVFLLLAGEIYTTFTFLGASGWAYGKGGPAFYILSYGALAYIMGYWMLPAVWRYAKENRLHSQSDFFVTKYRSPYLGVLVSLVAVVAMVPYLSLQFQGLGIIVSEASYGSISSTVAVVIGVVTVAAYVIISGIHGSAWTSVVKDIMVLGIVVFLGLYLPLALYGGIGDMFQQVAAEKPEFLTLPSEGESVPWFISTVLLTALGFYMWPHTFGSVFSAQNARIFRRNAIFMPLYQLIMLFAFFVGFAAILSVPGLQGKDADLSLLRVSLQQFDPWVVGLIGAAGLLTALVPGSMLLMVSATVLSKNVYKVFRPEASEERIGRLAKILVPVVALVTLLFTLYSTSTIVLLLLLGYALVTQLFPALLFSLMPNNFVTAWGAAAGIFVGVATVSYLTIADVKLRAVFPFLGSLGDTNIGVVALLLNIAVLVVVSFATRPSTVAREQRA